MSNNINTNTTALVRAMLHKGEDTMCPLVKVINGRRVPGARIEVVRQDPSGSWTWTELHLGVAGKTGTLDISSYPRREAVLSGYTRRVGKRQVCRTADGLTEWQEGNLSYATGRLQRQAHDEPLAFTPDMFVDGNERQLTRRGPKGTTTVSWLPKLLGERKKGKVVEGSPLAAVLEGLELPMNTSDAELVKALHGDADKGLFPVCLVDGVVPEALLLDLSPCAGWVAVEASTIPGLISLEEFNRREIERAAREDLKKNGLKITPTPGTKADEAEVKGETTDEAERLTPEVAEAEASEEATG